LRNPADCAKPVSDPAAVTTIFLVDDDPGVLKALSRVLREEGWVVETFASAEAFLARAERPADGCLVLDVSMPGLDGLALQRQLAAAGQALPVVFVTGHGDIPMSVKAIKAGASDFLTKPVQAQALVAAIRAAIAQDRSARDVDTDSADLRQRLERLTPREREVLAAVTAGRRNKEIAHDLGVVEQTVKFHRARIMERMQAANVAELMHMAARLGIGNPSPTADTAAALNGGSLRRLGEGPPAPATKPKASS
jgi:FixJ family two-component response regulator